jgi:hypothetical protein
MVTLLLLGSMARALTGTLGTAVHSHILFTGLLWILQKADVQRVIKSASIYLVHAPCWLHR